MQQQNQNLRKNRSKYYLLNKEHIRKQQAEYRNKNKTFCSFLISEWKKKNKEKVKAYGLKENLKDPIKRQAQKNMYKHRLKIQMPLWANKEKILEFYKKAKLLNLTVDHIIPLKGKLVSGLHVENNLQLLSKKDNSKKWNLIGD